MTHNTSALVALMADAADRAGSRAPIGYDDTPMQPNGKWRVHDGKRPVSRS